MSRWRNILLYLAFGGLLILAWFKLIDVHALMASLRDMSLLPVAAAMAAYVLAWFFRSIRWKVLIDPISPVSTPFAFSISMASLLINYALSFRAGDIAQCLMMRKLKGTPVSTSLSTVAVDRLMNISPIVPVLVVVPMVSFNLSGVLTGTLIAVLLIFITFSLALLLALKRKETILALLDRLLFFAPKSLRLRLLAFIYGFVEGIKQARINARSLSLIILLTLLPVALDGIYFFMMFRAFGSTVGFATVLFGYTLLNLTYILPMPPAQVGANELLMVLIFSVGLGVDENLASAVMVSAHVFTGLIIFVIGLASFAFLRVRIGDAISSS